MPKTSSQECGAPAVAPLLQYMQSGAQPRGGAGRGGRLVLGIHAGVYVENSLKGMGSWGALGCGLRGEQPAVHCTALGARGAWPCAGRAATSGYPGTAAARMRRPMLVRRSAPGHECGITQGEGRRDVVMKTAERAGGSGLEEGNCVTCCNVFQTMYISYTSVSVDMVPRDPEPTARWVPPPPFPS